MLNLDEIGATLKQMRAECGLSQEFVANELCISQSYLRAIEHDRANPTINMIRKIHTFLADEIEFAEYLKSLQKT